MSHDDQGEIVFAGHIKFVANNVAVLGAGGGDFLFQRAEIAGLYVDLAQANALQFDRVGRVVLQVTQCDHQPFAMFQIGDTDALRSDLGLLGEGSDILGQLADAAVSSQFSAEDLEFVVNLFRDVMAHGAKSYDSRAGGSKSSLSAAALATRDPFGSAQGRRFTTPEETASFG